jgi:hypothetical protein
LKTGGAFPPYGARPSCFPQALSRRRKLGLAHLRAAALPLHARFTTPVRDGTSALSSPWARARLRHECSRGRGPNRGENERAALDSVRLALPRV